MMWKRWLRNECFFSPPAGDLGQAWSERSQLVADPSQIKGASSYVSHSQAGEAFVVGACGYQKLKLI